MYEKNFDSVITKQSDQYINICLVDVHDYHFFSSEILNKTVADIETQLKTSEYKQLKISSAVASLEVAYMNLSKTKCSKMVSFYANKLPYFVYFDILDIHVLFKNHKSTNSKA